MRKPTVSGLLKDLAAANEEAKQYLESRAACVDEIKSLLKQIDDLEQRLKDKQAALEGCDRLCGILIEVIAHYQESKKTAVKE